jgi:hypothetical protein
MKTTYVIGAVAAMLLAASCSHKASTNFESTEIVWSDLQKINTNDEFADIFDSVEFIPLQTSDSCLLGDVVKVVESHDELFVLAEYGAAQEMGLYRFTKNGDYIGQIAHQGEGPADYSSLQSFDVLADTIYLLDGSQVKCYDRVSGEYLNRESAFIDPFGVTDIVPFGDKGEILIRTDMSDYNPAEYSTINTWSGNGITPLVEHVFDCSSSVSEMTATGPITDWNETSKLIVMPFEQAIYSLDVKTGEVKPVVKIATDKTMPKITSGMSIDEYKNSIDLMTYLTTSPISACKSGKWLVVGFMQGHVAWDMEAAKGYRTMDGYDSAASKSFPFMISHIVSATDDGGFLAWISAEQLLTYAEGTNASKPNMPKKAIIDSLSEDSNPVLIRYRLK